MTFLDLARARRSIRAYRPDPVPEALLGQILEAARMAPSACNRQPCHFIVVREAQNRTAFQAAYAKNWFWRAPVIIVACADTTASWRRSQDGKNSADIDVAIAFDHLTLTAHELGLGTCWICSFDPVPVRHLLGLPEHIEPVAMTPLGIPAEEGRPFERKALTDIVHYETWGRPRPPDA